MPGLRGTSAGRRMPRAWMALCLLALLPSGIANTEPPTHATMESTVSTDLPPPGGSSAAPTNMSHQESALPNVPGSTSTSATPQSSSGATDPGQEPSVHLTTATPEATAMPRASTVQAQTSATGPTPTALPSTQVSVFDPVVTPGPSTPAGSTFKHPQDSTRAEMAPTGSLTSGPPTPGASKGKITCSQVKEVRLTRGICLELNETSSCEDFMKDSGEELAQVLCQSEPAGAGPCSWLLTQSEVRPHCLLLVMANSTELSSKLQFLRKHQSELRKDEDPYYTEHGGGQGSSAGPKTSPEAQGKASVTRGAQENGTSQATSRNGHSSRQHVVADTEL
ncbi:hematopoietic progenitor cell antigen CD34 isoform X2 [Talpa occidentalis]|uniref:hematopoietic progenitor cell antigen CD34 isoform X2 n=1 Tax=Talpa occidentalis TaxID=50954 RepID=UPI0023F7DC48|nr:hematopoietic progenitor cell antigen CD34 isoform X2 [Talpa occidentalis]